MTSAKTSRPDSSVTSPVGTKPFDKLYWLRIALGVVSGVTAQVVFGSNYYNGIAVGVFGYLASYYIARFVWYKGFDRQAQGKIYSTGIGSYFLLFLFTWVLLFTLSSV